MSTAPRAGPRLFALASWHLFWYAWLALALAGAGRALRDPALGPLALLVLADLAFLGVAYLLMPRRRWALDYTQVSRGLLHVVPLLLFAGLLLAHALWSRPPRESADNADARWKIPPSGSPRSLKRRPPESRPLERGAAPPLPDRRERLEEEWPRSRSRWPAGRSQRRVR